VALRQFHRARQASTRRAQSENGRGSANHAAPRGDVPSKPDAARLRGKRRQARTREELNAALFVCRIKRLALQARGSERGAARLAHQSGGLGVESSNLSAPTI